MTRWRPHAGIRIKAIGLHWRADKLLASEVYNDLGQLKGVRPLGGTVEFGEPWQTALKREFLEELNVSIQISGAPFIFENIYQHEGHPGHEVIFAAEVELPDSFDLNRDVVTFKEDNGIECVARWFDLETLDTGGPELYPTGLKARLQNSSNEVIPDSQ
ncbi:NUDIX hydrolase [Parasedimentitalea huanghaiensis]|uniref:DNA mismatch repair protein MutT n=1 Tax=Parasedimentitalea huanghaiensis TaxID=2682100 RepID=A0A6L6WBZ8_9RHOB|nr:NUDIX domain-containing protein [Zongyanglinia huanghaiensis]MVO15363.1 DNA mismatch repair protein MutT [Zongyanglinia huanghaiensis]